MRVLPMVQALLGSVGGDPAPLDAAGVRRFVLEYILAWSCVSPAAQIANSTIYGTADQVLAAVGDACSLITLIDNSTACACVATAPSIANARGGLVFHKPVVDDFGI